MLRSSLLALTVLGGCDFVLQLKHVDPVGASCGPYQAPTQVSLDPAITNAQYFSTSTDGQDRPIAAVFGRYNGMGLRPIILEDVGGTWMAHPTMQAGLDAIINVAGANLAPPELTPTGDDYVNLPRQPVLMVWSGMPNELARYYWSGTRWTLDLNQTPITDGEYDVRAGNVVVVVGGGGVDDIVRHTIQVKRALDPTMTPDQIVFSANSPPRFTLTTRPDRTRPLNESRSTFGQGVVTDNLADLVYSVDVGSHFDIKATTRSAANDFAVGGEVFGINTGADELEPWITPDCSRIWFRRAPAGQPNEAGQIFVAEAQ